MKAIVNSGFALVNYHLIEISSSYNLIVKYNIFFSISLLRLTPNVYFAF